MKVLVDTPVWSYALRSKPGRFQDYIALLETLIKDHRVVLIGPVRQEILSSYSDVSRFEVLKDRLSAFPNTAIDDQDYVQAAEYYNQCRRNGIQGSHTDFLISAVAIRLEAPILTTDQDFKHYAKILPIKLYATKV